MTKTRKLTIMALTTAIALVLSFIESQIPAFVAIPGVKIGLPNIAIVYALYRLGWKEAAVISMTRVVLVSLLFGSAASFLYSFAGAVLSLAGMTLLKKTGKFTEIVVSVAGGVLHNIGQIAMASFILETDVLRYYLPFLLISGILAGVAVGLVSGILIRRIHLS
jgi:heptaprenyl diphosphate synthase